MTRAQRSGAPSTDAVPVMDDPSHMVHEISERTHRARCPCATGMGGMVPVAWYRLVPRGGPVRPSTVSLVGAHEQRLRHRDPGGNRRGGRLPPLEWKVSNG